MMSDVNEFFDQERCFMILPDGSNSFILGMRVREVHIMPLLIEFILNLKFSVFMGIISVQIV